MKRFKTLVAVTCNEKSQALPYTGIVVSSIGEIIFPIEGGIKVDVKRHKEDGTYLMRKWAEYSNTEVNTLYEVVKGLIPEGVGFVELFETAMNEAHKIEMASTFSINTSQIEEVTE